jgi:tRNA(Ile)-lysidine synthase
VELRAGGTVRLPGGWRLQAELLTMDVHRDGLPRDLWSAVCDFDLPMPLRVRAPRRGDRVRPLGLDGGRKLSELFIDRKVPADERPGYPVVEIDGEILWVPGIVRGESRPITPTTCRGLRLRAEHL